jgi:hypothetical protein
VNPFGLDPCPVEIQRLCHLITTPDYHVQGFWLLLLCVGMWTFLHFWAKEYEALALDTRELEQEGKFVGINSHNYVLVYVATRAGQLLCIFGALIGLSRLITGR